MGVVRTDESRRAEIEEFRRMLLSCSGVVLKVRTEEEYNRRQVPAASKNEYAVDQKLVCVTSGVSFLGIAIVKKLLLRGYSVRIIVDNEDDIERLREIEITEEAGGRSNITSSNQIGVVQANFNERRSLMEAFDGCSAVFHTAAFIDPSGLSGYSKIMAEVEARAAENIVEACAATSSVRNYVLTSSLLTCIWRDISDSSLSHVVDHNTWSDESFCKRKKLWYALGKLKAEHPKAKPFLLHLGGTNSSINSTTTTLPPSNFFPPEDNPNLQHHRETFITTCHLPCPTLSKLLLQCNLVWFLFC
ncbi:unnamed protein product [Lactuca virosa]|uniref:3-beta hydroxysteroid dehydrogenase/isomerase domain-containing protein n=1 Tax=Lactuca virosa TaxID=75947 RepID=A0AAU9MRY8_9ASTR|nr:unnamed protein product [Lactuca virosa]